MNSKLLVLTIVIGTLLTLNIPVMAEPDAKGLVKKADLLLRGEVSSKQLVDFVVYRPGQTIQRQMIVYLKGKQFSFTHIVEPIKDRDMTLLKRDHDMWMYTPQVRKTIRIPFAMMHEGVMGSDFTYDDIMKEATLTDDYSPVIAGTSKAMTKHGTVYVLDLTPLPGRPVAYKKLRVWIQEQDTIIQRIQYYNDELKVERVLEFKNVQHIGGRTIPCTWDMYTLDKKEHHTVYQIVNASFNDINDDTIFDQRSLDNPPALPIWGSKPVADVAYPNAHDLVKKADLLLRGETSSIQYVDFTVNRPDKITPRKMIVYLKGKAYSFTHVVEPVKDRDTTLLKRENDMWMYTPQVRKTIRIPFAMMHEGVLGSDFTYDDIMKEATLADDYSHQIVSTSKAMEQEHGRVFVIDSTPLPGRPVAYKKLRLWIKEAGAIMVRTQYYNDDLKVERVLQFSEIKKVGDRVIPTKWEMFNLSKKDYSTIYQISDANFNSIENDQLFDQRTLTSPPTSPQK